MTVAVLFAGAAEGRPGADHTDSGWADSGWAVDAVRVLAEQLCAAGAGEVRVLARPGAVGPLGAAGLAAIPSVDADEDLRAAARAAAECAGRGELLLLCAGDLVAHGSVLWHLATDPAGRSTALTGPVTAAPAAPGVREARSRIAEVLPPGAGDAAFLGALVIAPGDLALTAESCDKAAAAGAGGSAVDRLLPELVRAGVALGAQRVRLLHAERVTGAEAHTAARTATAAVDEDAARLRLAVKERDDFFTTYFVSPWSPLVTRAAARLRLTPTGVTAISVTLAVLAALAFWYASRPAMIAGAVLLYLGFVLDCVDGQLARYTRRFSPAGGWLDTMADRAKEYVVYAGLAAGAERAGLGHAWPLAIAALILQTVRHLTDAWYGALHDRAVSQPSTAAPTGGLGGRLGAASERVQADTGSPVYWLKRIVVFPIGERWALIALAAALVNGRVALLAALVWGALAAAYTLALRGLRARAMRVAVLTAPAPDRLGGHQLGGLSVADHRDDGPLARAIGATRLPPLPMAALAAVASAAALVAAVAGAGPRWLALAACAVPLAATRAPHTGPLDWLVPAALRAAEYLFVAAVGTACGVPYPVLFALVLALALHHYDLVARMEKSIPAAGPSPSLALGWDGRIVAVAVAALLPGLATALFALLAGYVGVVFGIRAAAGFAAPWPASVPVPEGGTR